MFNYGQLYIKMFFHLCPQVPVLRLGYAQSEIYGSIIWCLILKFLAGKLADWNLQNCTRAVMYKYIVCED